MKNVPLVKRPSAHFLFADVEVGVDRLQPLTPSSNFVKCKDLEIADGRATSRSFLVWWKQVSIDFSRYN